MSPIVFAGIGIPVAVLLAAGFAAILFDAMWAAAVLALGLIALVGLHVGQLVRLTRWADSDLDTPVPEAQGAWGLAYSAIFRRVRSRALRQRDLATTMERFRSAVEALPEEIRSTCCWWTRTSPRSSTSRKPGPTDPVAPNQPARA